MYKYRHCIWACELLVGACPGGQTVVTDPLLSKIPNVVLVGVVITNQQKKGEMGSNRKITLQ